MASLSDMVNISLTDDTPIADWKDAADVAWDLLMYDESVLAVFQQEKATFEELTAIVKRWMEERGGEFVR